MTSYRKCNLCPFSYSMCSCVRVSVCQCLTPYAFVRSCVRARMRDMRSLIHNIQCINNSIAACLYGLYGAGCRTMCNCTTLDTYCNPVTGCECHPGYYGSDCSNINECENDTTCDVHSTCVDLPGSFRCDCHDGYTHINATVCEGKPV